MRSESLEAGLSVLVSVYFGNTASEVARCLDSLLDQTLRAAEVVIVLDGPISSAVRSKINEYERLLNLKLISLQENLGLGQALNRGLVECRHEYVARIDVDDVCKRHRFSVQYQYMVSNPDVVVLGGQVELFDEGGVYGNRRVPTDLEAIRRYSRLRNPFNHSTVMFRKSPILKIGGYPPARFTQDYLLWVKCISHGYVVRNLREVLVAMHADQKMAGRRGLRYFKYDIKPYIQNYICRNNGLFFFSLAFLLRLGFNSFNSIKAIVFRLLY